MKYTGTVVRTQGYYDPHYSEGVVDQDTYVVGTKAQVEDAFTQDAYVVDIVAQDGEEGAWVNSNDCLAAHLLYAIYEGERLLVRGGGY